MIKQISTYGSVLLTAMVLSRAATLDSNEDLSSLYQRNQAVNHIESNHLLRANFDTQNLVSSEKIEDLSKKHELIVYSEKRKKTIISTKSTPEFISEDNFIIEIVEQEHALPEIAIETPPLLIADSSIVENTALSLDHESTNNSVLSTLFPRQRIRPKSSVVKY